MESQVIKVCAEEDIVIKVEYEDLEEYVQFIYWLIDSGATISAAEEIDVEQAWTV